MRVTEWLIGNKKGNRLLPLVAAVSVLVFAVILTNCKSKEEAPAAPEPTAAAPEGEGAAKEGVEKGTEPAPEAATKPAAEAKPGQPALTRLAPEDMRAKMQELNKLGAQNTPEARKQLLDTANNEAEAIQIRIAALKSLTRNAKPEDQEMFRQMLKTVKPGSPLNTEAAVGLYRAGATQEALPVLIESAKAGQSVSQAFFLGFEGGVRKYSPEAETVFKAALESKSPYAKLKAAGDLLYMGKKEDALKVFNEAIADERASVRMAALNYLQPHLKTVTETKALLDKLAGDADEKVRSRAERVLQGGPAFPAAMPTMQKAPIVAPKQPAPPTK